MSSTAIGSRPAGSISVARVLRFDALLTRSGWLAPAHVSLTADGTVVQVSVAPPPGGMAPETHAGWLIPGFQNAHSHAFQYAMAGLAEHLPAAARSDDFWSWRDAMYRLALRVSPEQVESLAAMLYAEMLRCGTTAVTEFHYLHHDVEGKPYAQPAEMGARLMAAARNAGIHLTLVPVLYRQGGFGKPATPAQRRFLSPSLEAYQTLLAATSAAARGQRDVLIGRGVHSLRAVAPEETKALLGAPFTGPAHLHIAEQRREVDDCLAYLGKRPVTWMLDELPVDRRFNLVHATHLDADEVGRLAASDATVVLCPSTEGNLGDGFFPLRSYLAAGGRYAIGSDSHVTLNPLEELRWLDYGQRLRDEKRNVLCQRSGEDSGALACDAAWERGRLAMGQEALDYVAPGQPLDGVLLDHEHPVLATKPPERRLAALIYAGDPTCFKATIRRGDVLVERGRHVRRDQIAAAFAKAMQSLMGES